METKTGEVDLQRVRLMALLNELVREHGQRGAAEVLELDRKTLWRSMERGELSRRLTDALEKVMLAGGGSAAAMQRERFAALEKGISTLEGRVGSLEEEVRGGLGEIRAAVDQAGQGRSGGGRLRELARRVAMLERGGCGLRLGPGTGTSGQERRSHARRQAGPRDRGAAPGRGGVLRSGHGSGRRVEGTKGTTGRGDEAPAGGPPGEDHGAGDRNARGARPHAASRD